MLIPLRSVVLSVLLLANFSSARPLPSLPSSNPKVFREPVAAALASKIAAINKQIGELPVLPGVPNGLKQATTTMAAMQIKVGAPTATTVSNPKNKEKMLPRRAVSFGAPLPSRTSGSTLDRRAVNLNPKYASAFPTTSKQPIKVAPTRVAANAKHTTTTSSEKIFSTPLTTTLKMVPVTFTLLDGSTKVVTRVGGPGHPGEPGDVSPTRNKQP